MAITTAITITSIAGTLSMCYGYFYDFIPLFPTSHQQGGRGYFPRFRVVEPTYSRRRPIQGDPPAQGLGWEATSLDSELPITISKK